MTRYLEGKVAIVTGSGQGIGRAIAAALAEQGAAVVTNNRRPGATSTTQLTPERLSKLTEEERNWVAEEMQRFSGDAESTAEMIRQRGGKAVACFADITDYDAAGRLIETAVEAFGGVDILVNVAGAFGFSPFEKMSPALFRKVTAVKLDGYFNTCRHAVPHMLEKGWGRILNCTSRAWLGDIFRHAEYCAANAGVVGLTRALAMEYAGQGITANCFSPYARTRSAIDLQMFDKTVEQADRVMAVDGATPRVDSAPPPEELTPLICYLCTDAAARVNGSVFNIGGSKIGLYSNPEIVRQVCKAPGERWTVEELVHSADGMLLQGYHSVVENYR